MKTLLRLGVIGLAALAVAGVAWLWVQNGGASALPGEDRRFEGERGSTGDFFDNGFPPPAGGRFAGGRGERGGFNVFGLNTVVKNLLIVGGLTLLVICASVVWGVVRPRLFPPRPIAPPTVNH